MQDDRRVYMTLFGEFSLSRNGVTIREPQRTQDNQSWQLLKYLAVTCGRRVTTDELLDELVFYGSTKNAGNTIRVRLRRCRDLLDELGLGDFKTGLVLYGNNNYWINGDYTLESDAQRIDALSKTAFDDSLPPAEALKAGIRALELFKGEYLALAKPSQWIAQLRESYHSLFRQLHQRALGLMTSLGDYSGAAELCASALRMLPESVAIHIRPLRALYAAGRIFEMSAYYARLAVWFANSKTELPALEELMQMKRRNEWTK